MGAHRHTGVRWGSPKGGAASRGGRYTPEARGPREPGGGWEQTGDGSADLRPVSRGRTDAAAGPTPAVPAWRVDWGGQPHRGGVRL